MRCLSILCLLALTSPMAAQWQLQDSHTTASLRGIHSIGNGMVAWASGTNGTVLRTLDGGTQWQTCTIPPGAEKLDFRGIQAFDDRSAIVMSSGKSDLSRLYKTVDGCQSWKLVFTNPDKEGFWDAIEVANRNIIFIAGDPIPSLQKTHKPQFAIYVSENQGKFFRRWSYPTLEASPAEAGAFAASNSSLVVTPSEDIHGWLWLGTGGTRGLGVLRGAYMSDLVEEGGHSPITDVRWESAKVPLAVGSSAGTFSVSVRGHETQGDRSWILSAHLVGVGGDYLKPDSVDGTATFTIDGGRNWQPAQTPPHGYRSAVAYFPEHKAWITVGPNGTDLSTDDGRNWRALKPGKDDAEGADRNWNALSLPFVVGPKGRIGKLLSTALTQRQ